MFSGSVKNFTPSVAVPLVPLLSRLVLPQRDTTFPSEIKALRASVPLSLFLSLNKVYNIQTTQRVIYISRAYVKVALPVQESFQNLSGTGTSGTGTIVKSFTLWTQSKPEVAVWRSGDGR